MSKIVKIEVNEGCDTLHLNQKVYNVPKSYCIGFERIKTIVIEENVQAVTISPQLLTNLKTIVFKGFVSYSKFHNQFHCLDAITNAVKFVFDYDGPIDPNFYEGINELEITEKNRRYVIEDEILYNFDKTVILRCSVNKSGHVTIPDTVKEIKSIAFAYCEKITSVDIPDSVKYIGTFAFRHSGLESVVIPNSVSKLSTGVFRQCLNLKNVTIDDGMEVIESSAFDGCSMLEKVKLPKTIKSIGRRVFADCDKLKILHLPSPNIAFKIFSLGRAINHIVIDTGESWRFLESIYSVNNSFEKPYNYDSYNEGFCKITGNGISYYITKNAMIPAMANNVVAIIKQMEESGKNKSLCNYAKGMDMKIKLALNEWFDFGCEESKHFLMDNASEVFKLCLVKEPEENIVRVIKDGLIKPDVMKTLLDECDEVSFTIKAYMLQYVQDCKTDKFII